MTPVDRPTLWFQTGKRLLLDWRAAQSYTTNEHPHPSLVHDENGWVTSAQPFSWTYLKTGQLHVGLVNGHLPDSPACWYLLIREPHRFVPSLTISAFINNRFNEGRVVKPEEFRQAGQSIGDAIGSIRWGAIRPEMEHIYVNPGWRGKGMSTKLMNVADILVVAGGQPGFLTGGTYTTPDGEALRQAWGHSTRVLERRGSMPPIT